MILSNIRYLFLTIFSFGYELTAAALPFFENYFDIKFQLPKIDIVAVPDFGFNAMGKLRRIKLKSLYLILVIFRKLGSHHIP